MNNLNYSKHCHSYEESLPVEGADLMLALESLVIATGIPNGYNNIRPLRIALRCLVMLSTAEPALYAQRTAAVVGAQLRAGGARLRALLEALAALGALGAPALPHLLPALQRAREDCKDPSYDGTTLVLICTVLLQERAGAALTRRINKAWELKIKDAIQGADGWTRYRVARAALRYGHQRLAADILKCLSEEAPSESAQRWLTALYRAANADAKLIEEGIPGLEAASAGWETFGDGGVAPGGACVGCSGCGACTALAPAWAAARAHALAALARTAAAARALCTQPPPAIALAHAQAARDPAAKAGACAGALRGCARALSGVAQRYAALARTAFHAHDSTLRHLHISQHTYAQMAQFLDRITSSQQERPEPVTEIKATSLEETIMLAPSVALAKISAKLFDNPTTSPGITHRHAEAALAAVRALAGGTCWARDACGGGGAGALCRVSLSPAHRPPPAEHAAALPLAHRLALKLEGVVLPPPAGKRKPVRQVKGVQITVTATPHPRTNEKTVELTNVPPVLTAVQTVTPVRDFFSAQQLVSVNTPGLYTVAVEAAFVDDKGELWQTGPRTAIVIKAHEDPSSKGNTQTTRGRF
ncbi:unnamed protein product [Euphydryas editha]|uniref:Integrator complex subunit 7 n=1 Tax=Euphydryas editha TaxID=104508 RepID=A0AAU9TFY7_EUPED|nr:unnamed protein product [Euphydryas editha]